MLLRILFAVAVMLCTPAAFAQTVQIDNLKDNKSGWGAVILDRSNVSLIVTLKHIVAPSYEGSIRGKFGFNRRNVLHEEGDVVVLGFNRSLGTGAYLLSLNDKGRIYVNGEESDYFQWRWSKPPRFITSLTADEGHSGQAVLDHKGHLVGLVQARFEDHQTQASLAFNEGRHMIFIGLSGLGDLVRRYR